jgi:hypothetical protein
MKYAYHEVVNELQIYSFHSPYEYWLSFLRTFYFVREVNCLIQLDGARLVENSKLHDVKPEDFRCCLIRPNDSVLLSKAYL